MPTGTRRLSALLVLLALCRRAGLILPDTVLDRSSSASKDDEWDRKESLDAWRSRPRGMGIGRTAPGSLRGAIRPELPGTRPMTRIHCDEARCSGGPAPD